MLGPSLDDYQISTKSCDSYPVNKSSDLLTSR